MNDVNLIGLHCALQREEYCVIPGLLPAQLAREVVAPRGYVFSAYGAEKGRGEYTYGSRDYYARTNANILEGVY